MRIIATENFKHGRVAFQKDNYYEVPERVGGYFVGNGWASDALTGDDADVTEVTIDELGSDAPAVRAKSDALEIQNVHHNSANTLEGN